LKYTIVVDRTTGFSADFNLTEEYGVQFPIAAFRMLDMNKVIPELMANETKGQNWSFFLENPTVVQFIRLDISVIDFPSGSITTNGINVSSLVAGRHRQCFLVRKAQDQSEMLKDGQRWRRFDFWYRCNANTSKKDVPSNQITAIVDVIGIGNVSLGGLFVYVSPINKESGKFDCGYRNFRLA